MRWFRGNRAEIDRRGDAPVVPSFKEALGERGDEPRNARTQVDSQRVGGLWMVLLGGRRSVGASMPRRRSGWFGDLSRRSPHFRAFLGTILVSGLAFGTFATPVATVQAVTPSCVSSGPAGGAYTVNACITA